MNDAAASSPTSREFVHSFRRNPLTSERTYTLRPEGLHWRLGQSEHIVPYSDIVEIREYRSKVWGKLAAQLPRRHDFVLLCRDGRRIALNPIHQASFGAAEDRSASCFDLIDELRRRVAAANPSVRSLNELHWSRRLTDATDRVRYRVGLLFFKLIRRTQFDGSADFAAWALRRIGPHLRGHRTARANLVAAYPDKSGAEIEQILSAMWENLGRLAVEYINLDRLVDPANPNCGRIVITPRTMEILARLREDRKPAVLFTSHLASYELGAIWVERNGLNLAIFYNPTNFGPLSEELAAMQERTMGRLVPSGPDAVWKLREAMKQGLHLALFADQHFAKGVDVTFFGRACKANPMAARFAQLFGSPVHGFRAIRLPGNRIQLEFTEELTMPRGGDGKIDSRDAMQMITAVIESWVRERPEQWLWLQRRWR
ncbi:MAG: lipid A biosynthesis lauroyl acyltransferase [Xanthobacteraceae bacterium]